MVAIREITFVTHSFPLSIRLAISTSPSWVNRGSVAISRRYHPDRVVGFVVGARRHIQIDVTRTFTAPVGQGVRPALLFRVDDLDTGVAEAGSRHRSES